MSFLKQLLTPFVEFDEEGKKKNAATPPVPAAPAQPAAAAPPAAPPPGEPPHHPLIDAREEEAPGAPAAAQLPTYAPSGAIAKPLPEHRQYFEKLIEDANKTNPLFAGADYKEFIDSKLDIDDIQDETLKYNTAFNILKNSGLTRQKLLETGQAYLDLIGRDMNNFQGAHALQYKKETRPKEEQIAQKVAELQQLTQRMQALKADINALTQDMNLANEKFNTTRNSFLLAGEEKQKEISAELQKIARYF